MRGALLFFKVIRQIFNDIGDKSSILTQIGRFRTVAPVWIHQWLWNDTQSLKQLRRDALLFFKVTSNISRSHGTKIADFDPNRAFPDFSSSLNSPMALKWCTKLNVVEKCPIVFQGHPSNFKVTRNKKSPILTRIEHFRTVTQVWLVIHEISRSHRMINRQFESNLRLLGWSQLSNPSDLPCSFAIGWSYIMQMVTIMSDYFYFELCHFCHIQIHSSFSANHKIELVTSLRDCNVCLADACWYWSLYNHKLLIETFFPFSVIFYPTSQDKHRFFTQWDI